MVRTVPLPCIFRRSAVFAGCARAGLLGCALLAATNQVRAAQIDYVVNTLAGGSQGAHPAGLVLSTDGKTLYGTTIGGGKYGHGMAFSVSTNAGSALTDLHDFTGKAPDGGEPSGMIVLSGNWLYIETSDTNGDPALSPPYYGGAIIAVNVQGDSVVAPKPICGFGPYPSSALGNAPFGGLVSDGQNLYGTTSAGGSQECGTVFSVSINGGTPTVLHNFCQGGTAGSLPMAGLTLSGNWLYGTTVGTANDDSGAGTVFAVNTAGDSGGTQPKNFTTLYSFGSNSGDGVGPSSPPLLFNGSLYGTTYGIGVDGATYEGSVYALSLNTSGSTPTAMYSWATPFSQIADLGYGGYYGSSGGLVFEAYFFWALTGPFGSGTQRGLYFAGTTEYGGMESSGSAFYGGMAFDIKSDGTGLQPLVQFDPSSGTDGEQPAYAALVPAAGGAINFVPGFFGTTLYGGNTAGINGDGTIFHLDPYPQMHVQEYYFLNGKPAFFRVYWTDPPGWVLQSAPSVKGPWTNIVNVSNPYTNNFTGSQQYFRLASDLVIPADPPTVNTFAAGNPFADAALLNGSISPNGADTTTWFKYGTTTNYGEVTPAIVISGLVTNNWASVTNLLSGLSAGTTYHCQLAGSNSAGVVSGQDVAFSPVDCVAPPSGVVNWWPADGSAFDVVGGDEGFLMGGVSYTNGKVGEAFSFNGTNGYVGTSLLITNPQTFSFTLWFQTTTTNGGVLISFDNTQTNQVGDEYDRNIYMDDSGALHFGVWNSGAKQINSSAGYNDGKWHYAVGSLSAGTGLSLYIDGVLIGNNSSVTNAQEVYNGYWRIGEDNLGNWPPQYQPNSFYFKGQLDEVAIFDAALASSSVTAVYDAGTNGMCQP